ncbi:MAG: hypothetical protein Q9170_002032 [Blastenia crenularia]
MPTKPTKPSRKLRDFYAGEPSVETDVWTPWAKVDNTHVRPEDIWAMVCGKVVLGDSFERLAQALIAGIAISWEVPDKSAFQLPKDPQPPIKIKRVQKRDVEQWFIQCKQNPQIIRILSGEEESPEGLESIREKAYNRYWDFETGV